jgi:hypothetical protein
MTDVLALAAQAAAKLDYTTDDLDLLAERDERFAAVLNDRDFLKHLDTLEFCCTTCEFWKPQRENATPDGAQWQCKECFDEQ